MRPEVTKYKYFAPDRRLKPSQHFRILPPSERLDPAHEPADNFGWRILNDSSLSARTALTNLQSRGKRNKHEHE